jgi:hypothetical protein
MTKFLMFTRLWTPLLLLAPMLLVALTATSAEGQETSLLPKMPPEVRAWFRNPDGSCVQCSIGMCGVWQNVPAATTLLWDTEEYGSKVRGGSYPSRVENYCDHRRIAAYNITGSNTWDWMKWAAKTGRMAAIGAGRNHFQTLVWYNPDEHIWYVCNNNTPTRIDKYSEAGFRQLHLASGQWVVILKTPAPPAIPDFTNQWWLQ